MAANTFRIPYSLGNPLAVGHSAPNAQGSFLLNSRVESYTSFTLQVSTTGGATYSMQIEGSLDNVNWRVIGQPVTGDGYYTLNNPGEYYAWVRLNVTDVTGGTAPTAYVVAVAIA